MYPPVAIPRIPVASRSPCTTALPPVPEQNIQIADVNLGEMLNTIVCLWYVPTNGIPRMSRLIVKVNLSVHTETDRMKHIHHAHVYADASSEASEYNTYSKAVRAGASRRPRSCRNVDSCNITCSSAKANLKSNA
jgi:hypothetical protein